MTLVATEALAVGCVDTWAGAIRVTASPAGVREVWLPDWREPRAADPRPGAPEVRVARGQPAEAETTLRAALAELAEYFADARRDFTVPLDARGTPFNRAVWREVARVPFGETRSYAEVARAVGAPRAVRAVGAANGANPVAPFVPCHRVVGSDGHLHGYGPGLPLKRRLLLLEDAIAAGPEDYAAWTARVATRRGGADLLLGVRGAGVYCRPDCPRALPQRLRPARFFGDAAEAERAGFRPCPACCGDDGHEARIRTA